MQLAQWFKCLSLIALTFLPNKLNKNTQIDLHHTLNRRQAIAKDTEAQKDYYEKVLLLELSTIYEKWHTDWVANLTSPTSSITHYSWYASNVEVTYWIQPRSLDEFYLPLQHIKPYDLILTQNPVQVWDTAWFTYLKQFIEQKNRIHFPLNVFVENRTPKGKALWILANKGHLRVESFTRVEHHDKKNGIERFLENQWLNTNRWSVRYVPKIQQYKQSDLRRDFFQKWNTNQRH